MASENARSLRTRWNRPIFLGAIIAVVIVASSSFYIFYASSHEHHGLQCTIVRMYPDGLAFGILEGPHTDGGPTVDMSWGDITIELTDGVDEWYWMPTTSALGNGSIGPTTQLLLSHGHPGAYCTVTDIAGNGVMQVNDFFIFDIDAADLSQHSVYTIIMIHKPTADRIGELEFRI